MRWRTSASLANSANCCSRRLPWSSAGWALPATTSWIGRVSSSSRARRRSGWRRIRVSRLYDGTRRANPIVRTSGSNAWSTQPSWPSSTPKRRQLARRRCRISPIRPARRVLRTSHRRASSRSAAPSQVRSATPKSSPSLSARSSVIGGAIQVPAWTPLVMWAIGTSCASSPGQTGENIERETAPCSLETPFERCARRRPMTAMLKVTSPCSGSRPRPMISSTVRPTSTVPTLK